jgi:hypothetical protein
MPRSQEEDFENEIWRRQSENGRKRRRVDAKQLDFPQRQERDLKLGYEQSEEGYSLYHQGRNEKRIEGPKSGAREEAKL